MRLDVGFLIASMLANIGAAIAQVDPGGPLSSWLSVLVQTGSFGLVVYLVVQGLPKLQKEIQEERNRERGEFARMLTDVTAERKTERTDYSTTMDKLMRYANEQLEILRRNCQEEGNTMAKVFIDEQNRTRQFFREDAEALRKVYFEAMGAMRTAVHEVKDVAQTTVNRAAVAIEVSKVKGSKGEEP